MTVARGRAPACLRVVASWSLSTRIPLTVEFGHATVQSSVDTSCPQGDDLTADELALAIQQPPRTVRRWLAGWHLSREHHATWRIKLATRDAAPALAAMERVGQAALEAAVREWEG